MAITALTWTYVRTYVTANKYLLKINAACTGDGTGGTISDTEDIGAWILTNSKCTLLEATHYQNDDVSRTWGIDLNVGHWEFLPINTIAAYHADNVLTGGNFICYNTNSRTISLPCFIGKCITTAPTIQCLGGTNTNTKLYRWTITLLVET